MIPVVAARLGARDWVWIGALMAAWAVVFALGVADGVRTGYGRLRVAVSSAATSDAYPTVVELMDGARVDPALEPGDVLRSLDGEDLAGWRATDFFLRGARTAHEQGWVGVQVEREGRTFESRLELTPTPLWWIGLLFPVALIGTALLLLVRAPQWHLARRYFVACWLFALLVSSGGPVGPPASALEAGLGWAFPFAAALTVWNAQDFTLSARPIPWLHRIFGVAVFVLAFAMQLTLTSLPFSGVQLDTLRVLSNVPFAAATLAGLTRAYLRSDPLERRQVRWILLGFYVTFSIIVCSMFALALGASSPAWGVAVRVTNLAIPAGILASVIGYRWLDVDRLISAAASYTIVGLAVLGGALALTPRIASAAAPLVGVDPGTGQWLLTMALVGLAIPVHRALRPRLDRRMFAERHERTRGFERLLEELGRCTSVEELVRLPGERMDALLEPESIAIYGREETVFTPVFVRGRGAPPAFETDSLLVRALERRVRPLAADAAELDPFDRAALETLGVSVLVPTRRGNDVVAFTCLGRKRSGDIYTPEEIAYLTAVANRCSEVLVKLDDEVVIREAREMQRALRRYVPGAVAEELAGGRELESGEREVSVLFVDIRGYSRFAEQRQAEEIFSTVNAYTERVSELVRRHGGSIVEFNGDGMMAVFGAPRALERKERAAVEAAREVVDALAGEIPVGVGVATGPAFVGNIRAADRLIWSAIGNTTNLAARLQSLTRELDAAIAIDDPTRTAAGYVCADFQRHADVPIRGRSERRDVWTLSLQS
jgi:class 3 adenylate cyclase